MRLGDGGCGDEGVGEDARGAELGGDAAGDVPVLALHVSARKRGYLLWQSVNPGREAGGNLCSNDLQSGAAYRS